MHESQQTKILLTGGHAATPAIAVIEEIKKRLPRSEISWIGSKSAMPGTASTTTEYKVLPKLGVKFYPIAMGKIQTKFTRYTIPLLFNVPISFFQTFFLLLKIKPDVILSFGGFASFPVMFWGFFFRIPSVLHEQTLAVGRASLASSLIATKIAVSRQESLRYLPRKKSVITGNPVMSEILKIEAKMSPGRPPVILVMGGSRGSQFINDEIVKIANALSKNYKVIHLTGEADYQRITGLNGSSYQVFSFVDPRKIAKYYEKADLIISRSGANTVCEIIATKRPAILIPLPRTFASEQIKNARYAEDFGIARVMLEGEVNSQSLLSKIAWVKANWQKMVDKVKTKPSPDREAADRVVDILEMLLK